MDDIVNFFNNLNKNKSNNRKYTIEDTISVNFINGPFVEILGDSKIKYKIDFIDLDTNKIIHTDTITPQHWVRASREWLTNWKINIYTNDKLVFEHVFNPKNKKIYIHLSSESIGDTLAWFPFVEEFRKKYECDVICSTFHNFFFEEKYKDIKFVKPGTKVYDLYAMFEIGIFDGNFNKNKNDHKSIPLQKVAADMLNIEFKEVRPEISYKELNSHKIPGKYVVICTESTAQCKYWNNENGWQEIVDYLNMIGYKVVVSQKNKSNLKHIIDKTGKNLDVAINLIKNAEFFIGISSGLSWISWALQKKTILISGFTSPWYEFNENCYRVYNKHSCKGCWHDFVFDKGDWNWCPLKRDFECSKTITANMVKTQILTLINEYDYFYTHTSKDEKINLTNSVIQFEFSKKFKDADFMFYEIFRNGDYDYTPCKIEENDIVLDIGANIGIFTKYAIAKGASEIYAFEPIKENYELLVKNNDWDNVEIFNSGISNEVKKEKFYIDSTSGGHTIINKDLNNTRTNQTQDIQCYSLDYLFEKDIIPHNINFAKIDAEGAEIKIFEGISNANLIKIEKFAIEWHDFLFDDKSLLDNLINRFIKLNYKFHIDKTSNDLMILHFWKDKNL